MVGAQADEITRLNKLVKWLKTTQSLAEQHSTCKKKKYGCIILRRDWSVASLGYNGSPPGYPHCEDDACPRAQENSEPGTSYDNCIAVHAEQNALLHAHDAITGATLVVNGPPCYTCAKLMASARISTLAHEHDPSYKQFKDIKQFLQNNGIEVISISLKD